MFVTFYVDLANTFLLKQFLVTLLYFCFDSIIVFHINCAISQLSIKITMLQLGLESCLINLKTTNKKAILCCVNCSGISEGKKE